MYMLKREAFFLAKSLLFDKHTFLKVMSRSFHFLYSAGSDTSLHECHIYGAAVKYI